MMISGVIPCKNKKERQLVYKKLKIELASKPLLTIWYDKNLLMYEYQSTRKEIFI